MSEIKRPFNNPFAALEKLRGGLGPRATGEASVPGMPGMSSTPTPSTATSAATRAATPRGPARAVVRLEKKGRRGKEVTVVEHLALPQAELEIWLKALKAGLGCGGVVEGSAIALQGDQRARVEPLLVARGVRKITIA